jgi:hypothetical protein
LPTPTGTFGPGTITEAPAPPFTVEAAEEAAAAASASSCAVGVIRGTATFVVVIPVEGDVVVDEAPPNPPRAPDNEAAAGEAGGEGAGGEGAGE